MIPPRVRIAAEPSPTTPEGSGSHVTRARTMTRAESTVVAFGLWVGLAASWSLMLAQVGAWSLPAFIAGAIGIGIVIGWRWRVRYEDSASIPPSVALPTALVVIGFLVLVLPGNRVSLAGTDPGVYVQLTEVIAETGQLDVGSPIEQYGLQNTVASADFAGLDPSDQRPGRLDFAFYHLYPALAAPAFAAGQTLGLTFVSPMLGALGIASLMLLLHRVRGAVAGVIGGAFFASSYLWVFFSDWNGSEVPTAALVLTALLAAVTAWDDDDVELAVVAGLLCGIAAASRLDGVLVLLLGVAVASLALAAGRPHLAIAGVAGTTVGGLQWGTQSYYTTAGYASDHSVPAAWLVLAAAAVLLFGGAMVRFVLEDKDLSALWPRGWLLAAGAYVLMLLAFWIRSQSSTPGTSAPEDARTWYPFAAERLTWFLGPVALALFLGGVVEVGRRRSWRTVAVVAPGLAVLPLYLWEQRISSQMIWAMRRFVPLVWPATAALVGLGAAALVGVVAERWGRRPVVPAVVGVLLVGAVAPQLRWTIPLRDLREWSGGFDAPEAVLDAYGNGLYLWVKGESSSAFAVPLLVDQGGGVVLLDSDVARPDLEPIVARVNPVPVFVIADDRETVAELGGSDVTDYVVRTERLEYTWQRVPERIEQLDFTFSVGRYVSGDAS